MDNIILYHGSLKMVEKPTLNYGKAYKDFGRGFYCTKQRELAGEWSCNENSDGYINRYEFDMTGLKVLNLSSKKNSILNWLAVLMDNRRGRISTPIEKEGRAYLIKHFLPDYRQYDVVVGMRGDDSYYTFAKTFVEDEISLRMLKQAMRLGKQGEQYALISEKALERLHFLDSSVADRTEYYPKRKSRDEKARIAFGREAEKDDADGIFMRDIVREEMEAADERLR